MYTRLASSALWSWRSPMSYGMQVCTNALCVQDWALRCTHERQAFYKLSCVQARGHSFAYCHYICECLPDPYDMPIWKTYKSLRLNDTQMVLLIHTHTHQMELLTLPWFLVFSSLYMKMCTHASAHTCTHQNKTTNHFYPWPSVQLLHFKLCSPQFCSSFSHSLQSIGLCPQLCPSLLPATAQRKDTSWSYSILNEETSLYLWKDTQEKFLLLWWGGSKPMTAVWVCRKTW